MGKLTSGILGAVSGKVAGVVGGMWKDKNYLRSYVIPANPKTAAQQTQRGLLATVVAFAKPLVGPVFNAYTDVFQKTMSGFNFFIKSNIAHFGDPVAYNLVALTSGKLWLPLITGAELNVDHTTVTITLPTSLGNNGAATDRLFAAVYNADTGIWAFAEETVARSTGTISVPVSGGPDADDLHSWTFAVKLDGTVVVMVSASGYHAVSQQE